MLSFDYETADGNPGSISGEEVKNMLAQAGYNVIGASPDGESLTIDYNGQIYDAPLNELVAEKFGNIKGMKPSENAIDYGGINLAWRAMVDGLPNDDNTRKAFLEGKLKNVGGVENAKLVGSGSDWYYFNPDLGKYQALTNKPGLDMSDVFGFMPSAAKGVGAMVGAAAGGVAGSLPGAALGGAAGSQVADLAMQGVGSLVDKDYRGAIDYALNSEEARANIMRQKSVEIPLEAGLGALTKIPGFSNYLNRGISSRALDASGTLAKGGGRVAELAGTGIDKIASVADNPMGKSILSALGPAGTVSAPAALAELPEMLLVGGARGSGRLASGLGERMTSAASNRAPGGFTDFLSGAGQKMSSLGERTSALLNPRGTGGFQSSMDKIASGSARDVLGNVGERTGRRLGLTEEGVNRMARFGEGTGSAVQGVGEIGRLVQKPIDWASGMAVSGVRGIGQGVAGAGKAAQSYASAVPAVSSRLAPLEGQMLAQGGISKLSDPGGAPQNFDDYLNNLNRTPQQVYGGKYQQTFDP